MEGKRLEFITIVVLIAVGAFAIRHLMQQARRKRLMEKYGDAEIVDRIMNKMVWQGMTVDHLVDALGKPVAIDRKVLKTKTNHTYKYGQTGKNRFSRRVMLENDVVVGWDFK
jgi:hypothetical protein